MLYRGRPTGDTCNDSSVWAVLDDSVGLCDGVGGGCGAARGEVKDSVGAIPGEILLEDRAGGPEGISRILLDVGDSIGFDMLRPCTVGPPVSFSRVDTEDADRSCPVPEVGVGVDGRELCAEDPSFLDSTTFTEFWSESPLLGRSIEGRELESRVGGNRLGISSCRLTSFTDD